MNSTPDRIERSIDIDADAHRVYELVARAGWWINDGAITDNIVSVDGDVTTVNHPKYGDFRIRTERAEPPRYVAFRWLGGDSAGEKETEAPTALVEFWVDDRPGGVTLKVRESGFIALYEDEDARRRNYDANVEGWTEELEAARRYIEGA